MEFVTMGRNLIVLSTISLLIIPLVMLTHSGHTEGNGIGTSDTTVGSDITTDTTWTPGQSPYIVDVSVKVTSGATLTIQPGTTVKFGSAGTLLVEGAIMSGGEGGTVTLTTQGTVAPGSYPGVQLGSASHSVFERTSFKGAKVGLDLNDSDDVTVRNCSFASNTADLRMGNSSIILLDNSTLNIQGAIFIDGASKVITEVRFSGMIWNYRGQPAGNKRIELTDSGGTLRLSYITNSTGEVPEVTLRARTLTKGGWDDLPGTYSVSLSDDPLTHYVNSTLLLNGTEAHYEVFRYFWAPEISMMPRSIYVNEDQFRSVPIELVDRNGAGTLSIVEDSENVVFNSTTSSFELVYTDESVTLDKVNITITDGYDHTDYLTNVSVAPRPDPPVMGLGYYFATIFENRPAYLPVLISDEDTPIQEMSVTTSDPANATYHAVNNTVVLLYPDGADEYFDLEINVSDGTTEVSQTLNVRFIDEKHPPTFSSDLPDIVTKEDEEADLDLADYIYDPDSKDLVRIFIDSGGSSIFSASLNGTVMTVSPFSDMNGKGIIQIKLVDSGNLFYEGYLNVTVVPVNDPPFLADGSISPLGPGDYRFNVTYYDLDGDLPEKVALVLDGEEVLMNSADPYSSYPMTGMPFTLVLGLEAGNHTWGFLGTDGEMSYSTPLSLMTVPPRIDLSFGTAYSGALNLTISSIGEGPLPAVVLLESPLDGPPEMTPAGCDFSIVDNGRRIVSAKVRIDMADFRSDIVPSTAGIWYKSGSNWSEAGPPEYSIRTGILIVDLSDQVFSEGLHLFAELDPTFDSDGDGWNNLIDAFPEDRDEWNDTDLDHIGDNADQDDDNDNFTDEVEALAGTDPLNPRSYPKDTDLDGKLDYIDDDDDGDGMPDDWEREHLLDPMDASDAAEDPDADGKTNLEEYVAGTDPFDNGSSSGSGPGPTLLWIIVGILLAILIAAGAIFMFALARRKDEFEVDDTETEDEWEVKKELDADDAVVCLGCSEIYPRTESMCPFCKSEESRPYSEE